MSKRNYRQNNGHKTKKRAKPIITAIILFVVCVITLGCVASCTGMFNDKKLNEENLLTKKETYFENLQVEWEKGLKVTWRDDGSFYLRGKYYDDNMSNNAHMTYNFASITLEPGVYVLSSGNDKDNNDTAYLYAIYNGTTVTTENNGEARIEITEEPATVVVGFAAKNNVRFLYCNYEPTLAKGDKAIPLYVEVK